MKERLRLAATVLFLAAALAGTLLLIGGSVPNAPYLSRNWPYHIRVGWHWGCVTLHPLAAHCPGAWDTLNWSPP